MSIVCDKLLQGLGKGAAEGRSLPPLLWREEDQEGVACPFFSEPLPVIPFWIWHATLFPLLHPFGWVRGHSLNLLRDLYWESVERSQRHQRRLRSFHEEFFFFFSKKNPPKKPSLIFMLFYQHICHMESPLISLKAFLYKDNTLPIDQDTDGTEVISII